jgi:hypothetical protein
MAEQYILEFFQFCWPQKRSFQKIKAVTGISFLVNVITVSSGNYQLKKLTQLSAQRARKGVIF